MITGIISVIVVFLLLKSIVVVNQYERGIVLTLGTYSYTLGPGLKLVVPIFQRVIKVDIRINTIDIPQQSIITRDNVSVGVNGVVYFQVIKAEDAVLKVRDFTYAMSQYAQTALRDVIGSVELDQLLTDRQKISDEIQKIVDSETADWGLDVTGIRLQDITVPDNMKQVMAKQAEAERERRATIIRAEGEMTASENLKKAMENMSASGAITLRSLQTIENASNSNNNTLIFAVPVEILEGFKKLTKSDK
ncbi:MAG: SPFH domain-containing protein [Candidatus Shapirobacteria bacterium]|jgi:regulator of protease activity HflC (stomatin/prohibitin superfamily)